MRRSKTPTEDQIVMMHENWKRISRLGLPLFILLFGSIILAWMCICYVGFTYLSGKQELLHDAFVIESTLPCMMLISYCIPLFYYLSVRRAIRRIDL
jgi:hypothetical protein